MTRSAGRLSIHAWFYIQVLSTTCFSENQLKTEFPIWVVFCRTVIAYISHYETSTFGQKQTLPRTENPAGAGFLYGDYQPRLCKT